METFESFYGEKELYSCPDCKASREDNRAASGRMTILCLQGV